MKRRLDQRVVELGLAPTRSKAQRLIDAGEVLVDGHEERQISRRVDDAQSITRGEGETLKYVSRGGLKLEGALKHFGLDVQGFRCLDVGLSTGGFTDCLLGHGATAVFGLDVGHGQLDPKLAKDSRVSAISGLHVRDLPTHAAAQAFIAGGLDLTVVDVSFISLAQVYPHLPRAAPWLLLFKPQFEVGREHLNKNGVVRDPRRGKAVVDAFAQLLRKEGWVVDAPVASVLAGQDGNQEFFSTSLRHLFSRRLGRPFAKC